MQDQGKIRHIGLSEVTPAEIEQAQKIVPIVSVQNRYSLADRRHEETLNWCEQRGIAFLPWYPMAAGKLLKPDHPFSQTLAQMADALQRHSRAAFDRVASASFARHAAHPRHVAGQTPRRKHRRRQSQCEFGRVGYSWSRRLPHRLSRRSRNAMSLLDCA